MSNKEIISVAFKLFSIYILLQAVSSMTQYGTFAVSYFQGTNIINHFVPIVAIIALLALSYGIWRLSDQSFIHMTISENSKDEFKVDQVFVLNLVGLYLLFNGLLELISGIISLLLITNKSSEIYSSIPAALDLNNYFYIGASTIKIVIALTLILRSKGWLKLFNKIRYWN